MSGRSSGLLLLLLFGLQLTGAAFAAPVAYLEIGDGVSVCGGPLPEDGRFSYTYTQSIYGVSVEEDLERHGRGLSIRSARSGDIRAVEYFRWEGPIREDERGFVQEAPPNEVEQLLIRISPEYGQRVGTAAWSCDLPVRFGDGVVAVRGSVRPAVMAGVE